MPSGYFGILAFVWQIFNHFVKKKKKNAGIARTNVLFITINLILQLSHGWKFVRSHFVVFQPHRFFYLSSGQCNRVRIQLISSNENTHKTTNAGVSNCSSVKQDKFHQPITFSFHFIFSFFSWFHFRCFLLCCYWQMISNWDWKVRNCIGWHSFSLSSLMNKEYNPWFQLEIGPDGRWFAVTAVCWKFKFRLMKHVQVTNNNNSRSYVCMVCLRITEAYHCIANEFV